MLCLCHYGPALLRFWFQTDLEHENSASCFKNRGGEDLFLPWSRSTSNFYALIGQNLKSEFLRIIMHCLETCLLWQLKLAEFCVNLWFFNYLFPLDVQNEKQLLSRVFCYSWLVCLLGCCLKNASLIKVGNLISDGIVFVFHFAWCVRGFKSLKRFWPYLIAFRSCISNGKPEQLFYLMFFFFLYLIS